MEMLYQLSYLSANCNFFSPSLLLNLAGERIFTSPAYPSPITKT